jgi:hypothetical protein
VSEHDLPTWFYIAYFTIAGGLLCAFIRERMVAAREQREFFKRMRALDEKLTSPTLNSETDNPPSVRSETERKRDL